MKTRRKFIYGCSGALVGAAVLGVAKRQAAPAPTSLAAFAAQVGSSFVVTAESAAPVALVLKSAEPHGAVTSVGYSLEFTSTASEPLEQGTYRFQHPVLGAQDIFVVPNVARSTRLVTYTAIFNGPPPRQA